MKVTRWVATLACAHVLCKRLSHVALHTQPLLVCLRKAGVRHAHLLRSCLAQQPMRALQVWRRDHALHVHAPQHGLGNRVALLHRALQERLCLGHVARLVPQPVVKHLAQRRLRVSASVLRPARKVLHHLIRVVGGAHADVFVRQAVPVQHCGPHPLLVRSCCSLRRTFPVPCRCLAVHRHAVTLHVPVPHGRHRLRVAAKCRSCGQQHGQRVIPRDPKSSRRVRMGQLALRPRVPFAGAYGQQTTSPFGRSSHTTPPAGHHISKVI
mmetsp:Transcript_13279/g.42349  ORF Transcript_13279/g.42349 Transcript_13279/m.42349 type:complete len:267 (-) Transcript_13279:114-914(-)